MLYNIREIIAYGLIGMIGMIVVPTAIIYLKRRKRDRLRRRGIKHYEKRYIPTE